MTECNFRFGAPGVEAGRGSRTWCLRMDIHEDETIFLAYRERMDLQSLKEAMQILRTTEGLGGVRRVLKESSNVVFSRIFSSWKTLDYRYVLNFR
jgi:hypothetical protein